MLKNKIWLGIILSIILLVFNINGFTAYYKYTQESGTNFYVGIADKADALEDTNEMRQIIDDLGALLAHSKRDGVYPKGGDFGGTIQIPEAGLKFGNDPANNDIAAYIAGEMMWKTKAELGLDLTLYYLQTEIDTLSEIEAIYTKDIIDSDELATLKFTDLADTPTNYTDKAGKYVKVNAEENALEFGTPAGGGTYLGLTDTPAAYNNGKYAKSTADGVIWDDPAGAGDMLKTTYDTDTDGIVDKSETVDDGAGNSSTAADVKDAVTKKHSQNTDTDLDNTFEATFAKKADKLDVFAATTSAELAGVISDKTGSNKLVYSDSPTIDAPIITGELGGEMDAGAHTIGFTLQTDTGTGEKTIDWKLGNKMKFTFGAGDVTFTFTAPTNPCTLMLTLIQDGTGSRTVTWPATVKWPGGTAPTLTTTANARDKIALDWDGTQYDGVCSKDFK